MNIPDIKKKLDEKDLCLKIRHVRHVDIIGGIRAQAQYHAYLGVPFTKLELKEMQSRGIPIKFKAKGGTTRVFIVNRKTNECISTGRAFCSKKDAFNRKLGLAIAVGRALSKLEPEFGKDWWK